MKRRGFLGLLFVAPLAKAVAAVRPDPIKQATYAWWVARKQLRRFRSEPQGMVITWTELRQDGITVLDSGFANDESKRRFTKLIEHKFKNLEQSWKNNHLKDLFV